ncbi:unnamed protein product [Parascedosporium putredinis]|uniref:Leucine-rich repeat-containing protein 40 n=1 Tax=Parascedosporium putredinis TaxID=1442378 RepID=A0A9P1GZA8_9PEZI|nr:unnamed protein product [Parascedosporium putredinis]CAI7992643.1 unnamed protein product [Parascedosporium putredinis]
MATTALPPPGELEEAPSPSAERSRKSSAALREQIAKARAAVKKPIAMEPEVVEDEPCSPVTVVHDGFDFGLEPLVDDPFNQNRSDKSQAKVLQQRAEAGRTSGNWAESMDLTRLVAADNEFEVIDDAAFPDVDPEALADSEEGAGNIFGGLEMIDFHGNKLCALPAGLRRLRMLTSLNLVIAQISGLRDLKLANNCLSGALPSAFFELEHLETLDLRSNKITEFPTDVAKLTRLRILNIGDNAFAALPVEALAKLPLTELVARSNKLTGTLIDADSRAPGNSIALPALHQITLSMNRLQGLPDVSSWTSLVTLSADENSIPEIPDGFPRLERLRHADFSSNDIRVIPRGLAHG